ncbi:alpha/beta hydrolase [Streptomyces sp. NPDC002680]|uniref:alpha/beta hydrolase n=1 Tax=Streptomyces sp. NPDC002680 TaxID=3364659 RepID=UPI0036C724B5
MTYDVDPELVPWMEMLQPAPMSEYQQARENMAALLERRPPYESGTPLDVRDVRVPGPEGAPEVAVRVFSPSGRGPDERLPGLVFIHGGGFVLGSVDGLDYDAARIADQVGAVVVCVEYRLAPENPFPAGLEDCYAALTWTAAHADELGIDPERLGAGGESAGGGLTAALALLARDRGGPALCFQYLGIPELDDRLDTPSMRDYTDAPMWDTHRAGLSWDYYLGGPGLRGGPSVSPYAAPARVEDVAGLPPAYVSVCQFDPLRDEGIVYAQRLMHAGILTELHQYPGTFHGAAGIPGPAVSERMTADMLSVLRRGLRAGKE